MKAIETNQQQLSTVELIQSEPGWYPGQARRAAEGTHPKAYPTDHRLR